MSVNIKVNVKIKTELLDYGHAYFFSAICIIHVRSPQLFDRL